MLPATPQAVKPPERTVHWSFGHNSVALPYSASDSPVAAHTSREASGVVLVIVRPGLFGSATCRATGAQKSFCDPPWRL